ncbi:outer dense fiber protein 3-B-like [Daktulosphaira vitifoliae]|uniref:outer dense fiber protein 3-B-like n=1 Tax=Daktulosphaira vitifoliae TaxID=58002 RepID=UPI0021AA8906|nr:outer dense fiber protein 3-B-like [Daktulosphaira vitifoliae]
MLKKQYCTPGPKYSCPTTIGYEKTDVRLPRAPAFSLGQRIQSNSATYRSQLVPGPKYDLSNVTRYGCIATPAAFLVSRIKEPKRNIPTPSPASYNIPPSVPAKPAFTLGLVTTKFLIS